MSLHTLAKEVQKRGRGDDKMLVHMTPGEVKGLQALAMAHGGSLSINPNTGLVEAGFLKNILPMIAGIGLNAMFPGSGALIGLGVGGLEAARTGDVGKGLMAGLGAYGGANLGQALSTAGAEALTGAAQTSALSAPTAEATTAYQQAMESGLSGDAAQKAFMNASNISQPSYGQQLMAGAKDVLSSPTNAMEFGKQNLMNIGAAAAPVVAGAMAPKTEPLPGAPEEEEKYKTAPYRYNLASNFSGYTPARPSPFYRPTGLGYAAGGDVMMAAGGSYSDDPLGDAEQMASGGQLGSYSDGGRMLKGPGDGMSDSIPGVINNKQPARLADGEFVVPADVVSHLGNGSTDAGARKLYSMMDKVRTARTGKKKQAPAVKTDKFIPA